MSALYTTVLSVETMRSDSDVYAFIRTFVFSGSQRKQIQLVKGLAEQLLQSKGEICTLPGRGWPPLRMRRAGSSLSVYAQFCSVAD